MTNNEWIRNLSNEELGNLLSDWIRNTSDVELAEIIEEHSGTCRFCSYYGSCTDFGLPNCCEGRLEWLMQEHKEDKEN